MRKGYSGFLRGEWEEECGKILAGRVERDKNVPLLRGAVARICQGGQAFSRELGGGSRQSRVIAKREERKRKSRVLGQTLD